MTVTLYIAIVGAVFGANGQDVRPNGVYMTKAACETANADQVRNIRNVYPLRRHDLTETHTHCIKRTYRG